MGSFKQGVSAGLLAGAVITTVIMISGGNWWGAVGGMIAGALWHPALFLIFNRT